MSLLRALRVLALLGSGLCAGALGPDRARAQEPAPAPLAPAEPQAPAPPTSPPPAVQPEPPTSPPPAVQDGAPAGGAPARTVPGTRQVSPRFALPAQGAALRIPPRVAARQRVLEADLAALGARSEGRILNGALEAAVGGAMIVGGVFVPYEAGRALLILVGAGALAHGVVRLALVPDAGKRSRTYTHLPAISAEQVRERIRFGEQALERLARASRRARIVDGTISMAVASAYVPILWWLERSEDPRYRFGDTAFDYLALALSGIGFGSGLVTALVETEAERRARDYRELKQRFEREAPGELERLSLTVGGGRNGAALSARLSF